MTKSESSSKRGEGERVGFATVGESKGNEGDLSTVLLEWNDEREADSNGDEFVVCSTSVDERFDITPNYYDSDGEKPVDFTLEDNVRKAKKTCDSVAQCKKAALAIINTPPPKVFTLDEQIQNAANAYHMNKNGSATTRKWAERDADKASAKFGVDVRAIPMSEDCKAAIDKMMSVWSK